MSEASHEYSTCDNPFVRPYFGPSVVPAGYRLLTTGYCFSIFDGAGQKVATKSGDYLSVSVYDAGGKLAAEYSQYAAPTTANVDYITPNYQGSTSVVTDNAGAVKSRHDYLPFGEEIGAGVGSRTTGKMFSQPDSVRQKYAGMETDDATGLNHTLWRKDDNWSGRWTSPDPYGGSMSVASPQTFNRYAYVSNDPINHVDPLGLALADIGVYQTDDSAAAQAAQNHSDIEFRESFRKKVGVYAPPITVGGGSGGKGGGDPHLAGSGGDKSGGDSGSEADWNGSESLNLPLSISQGPGSRRQKPRRRGERSRLPRAGSGGQLRPATIPGAPVEAQAVSAALAVLRTGCYDDSSFSPSVTPRNRYFANVENPGQFTGGWHRAFSIHNSGALESPVLVRGEFEPSTDTERSFLPPGARTFEFGFVLKYYPGEGMAVTPSTDSEMHWIGALEFTLKNPDVNINFARQFLNVAPRCGTH